MYCNRETTTPIYSKVMNHLKPRERDFVLNAAERVHEKLVLGACLIVCLGFFVKVVFF